MSRDKDKGDLFTRGPQWPTAREKDRAEPQRTREPEPPPADETKIVALHPSTQRGEDSPVYPPDRVYKAFDTHDRAMRLQIVPANGMAHRAPYHSLYDESEDVVHESCFALYFHGVTVKVYGSHLGPVMHAIGFETCSRIRAFTPEFFDPPPPGQPFIEKIVITAPGEA